MRKHKTSYWGAVQYETVLCPGIHIVGTASHGGIVVDAEHLERMPEFMRSTPYSPDQWFEEDSDWCLPVVCFEAEILAGGDADAVRWIESSQHIKEFRRGHAERCRQWAESEQAKC